MKRSHKILCTAEIKPEPSLPFCGANYERSAKKSIFSLFNSMLWILKSTDVQVVLQWFWSRCIFGPIIRTYAYRVRSFVFWVGSVRTLMVAAGFNSNEGKTGHFIQFLKTIPDHTLEKQIWKSKTLDEHIWGQHTFPSSWWNHLQLMGTLEAYFSAKMFVSSAASCLITRYSNKEPRASGSNADRGVIGGTVALNLELWVTSN